MRQYLAQLRFELTMTARRGESLLVTIIIPLMLLVFFGLVPVLASDRHAQLRDFLPGLLALAVMSTGMVSLGIATAFERQYGLLKRLGSTPLTRPQLLAAKASSAVMIVVVQSLLLMGLAYMAFGWRPEGQVIPTALLVLAGLTVFASIGLGLAGALRAELTLALANALYLFLLLLGGIAVPTDKFPQPLSSIAGLLPSAALTNALRASLAARPWSVESLGVLAAWLVVAPVLAARSFQWE